MSVDQSGAGTIVTLYFSKTFPVTGIAWTAAPDDVDPFDFPSMQIADGAMGGNGDLITWAKANPLKWSISVIPNSFEGLALNVVFQNNRVGRGKTNVNDSVKAVIVYPNLRTAVLSDGRLTDGTPGLSWQQSGRIGTMTYSFIFEKFAST
jgi:hypothetical protein